MPKLKVIDSPRLYVNAETVDNLQDKLHSKYLKATAEEVLRDANRLVRARPLTEDDITDGYQSVTRPINNQLHCLTAAWILTHEAKYRQAALRHLGNLTTFRQISCEANHTIPASVDMAYCLSYGELCATVGLMFDVFRAEITDEERQVFQEVLDRFLMKAAVASLDKAPWWAFKKWSNWNGVCSGGMGLMALAFYKDHPDAWRLIPFVEKSLAEYFKSFIDNGGGCHEGAGYWNYGMNFAMRYVLSWENATGQKHPALQIKELGKSLHFPLDFAGISFGDHDGWGPVCFFFMLAKRLNQPSTAMNAAVYLGDGTASKQKRVASQVNNGDHLYAADFIPTDAEMEKLKRAHEKKKSPIARIYKGLDWASLADDDAFPTLRMSVRGGSSEVTGHGMTDLLSLKCQVNGELMITGQEDGVYMATTFTNRGQDLYGRSPASKSTLFVDGLGCNTDARCKKTEVVKGSGLSGIRVDGSSVYMPRWKDTFIGRLCLLVDGSYWLVIDGVQGVNDVDKHWAESRFHTTAESTSGRDWVRLKSGKERMTITFATLDKGVLRQGTGMPAQPGVEPTTIYRWMGAEATHENLHVAALNPGNTRLKVEIQREKNGYLITVKKQGAKLRKVRITGKLKLRKG